MALIFTVNIKSWTEGQPPELQRLLDRRDAPLHERVPDSIVRVVRLSFPASGDVHPLMKRKRTDQRTDVPRSLKNNPREE